MAPVRVLDAQGRARNVEVASSSSDPTVDDLMTAVERDWAVPRERQRLICSGRIMKASEPLMRYSDLRTVHLFPLPEGVAPRTEAQRVALRTDPAAMSPALLAAPPFDMAQFERQASHFIDLDDDDSDGGSPRTTTTTTPTVGDPLGGLVTAAADRRRRRLLYGVDAELGGGQEGLYAAAAALDAGDLGENLGTQRDFYLGFAMGFVLGFIMLLYLWERSVPHKQKLGILAGASTQLVLKYIHSATLDEADVQDFDANMDPGA